MSEPRPFDTKHVHAAATSDPTTCTFRDETDLGAGSRAAKGGW